MNKKQPLVTKFLALAVIAAVAVFANRATAAQQFAKIIRIRANTPNGVEFSTDSGGSWIPAHLGDLIPQSATIRTAKGASVDLILGPGDSIPPKVAVAGNVGWAPPEHQQANILKVFESSYLKIDKLTSTGSGTGEEVSDTELDLQNGKIMGSVKPLTAGSHYEVKVPGGVAGIRGTVFSISSTGVLDVLSGSVTLEIYVPNPAGGSTLQSVTVSTGQSYTIPTGMTASIPPGELTQMQVTYQTLGGVTTATYVTTGADNTVIYISPVNPTGGTAPSSPPPSSPPGGG